MGKETGVTMIDDNRLMGLERQVQRVEKKMDMIDSKLDAIAVQSSQISDLQSQFRAVWRKMDQICAPDGIIATIQSHQSSCPRGQMKFLWTFTIGIASALGATWVAVLHYVMEASKQ